MHNEEIPPSENPDLPNFIRNHPAVKAMDEVVAAANEIGSLVDLLAQAQHRLADGIMALTPELSRFLNDAETADMIAIEILDGGPDIFEALRNILEGK